MHARRLPVLAGGGQTPTLPVVWAINPNKDHFRWLKSDDAAFRPRSSLLFRLLSARKRSRKILPKYAVTESLAVCKLKRFSNRTFYHNGMENLDTTAAAGTPIRVATVAVWFSCSGSYRTRAEVLGRIVAGPSHYPICNARELRALTMFSSRHPSGSELSIAKW